MRLTTLYTEVTFNSKFKPYFSRYPQLIVSKDPAGEGGEKPYRLLADALASSKRATIAELVTRGKEQFVLIRPYENGLIMHSLYYANEVRNFAEIAKGENSKLSEDENRLGATLIENMSEGFELEKIATNTASGFKQC